MFSSLLDFHQVPVGVSAYEGAGVLIAVDLDMIPTDVKEETVRKVFIKYLY